MVSMTFSLEYIVSYFALQLLLPLVLFLVMLFGFWYVQSKLVIYAYYRLVMPELRKNKLLYWIVGAPAVASHEVIGHALLGAITGSSPSLQAPIRPESSAVQIQSNRTAMGYLSSIIATIAPCFAPPFILIIFFHFFYPNTLSFSGTTLLAMLNNSLANIAEFLAALFNSNLLFPLNAIFLYLVMITSLTAGASSTDFKLVIGQTKKYWYFALFLILVSAICLEVVRLGLKYQTAKEAFYPIVSAVILSFIVVLIGLLLALGFVFYLKQMQSLGRIWKFAAFATAPIVYYILISNTLYFHLLPRFTEAFVISSLAAVAIQILFLIGFRIFSSSPARKR